MKAITTNVKARHESNRKLKSIADQLAAINKEIEILNHKYNKR